MIKCKIGVFVGFSDKYERNTTFMRRIEVNTGKPYEILVERSISGRVGAELLKVAKVKRVMVVTDETVEKLYFARVKSSLDAAGIEVFKFVITSGERSKSTRNLVRLWETLAESEITRSDVIIALGGGVVGDLAGFAAATFLRGIKYVQIPTTLLAMTDSSVGGKTAVDLEAGKNLAGAFHQPCLVLCDPETLVTLPKEHMRDGMAEVIKYGMINRPELIDKLYAYKQGDEEALDEIISICIEDKRDIVSDDEFDTGIRALLNFGHTPAHAIELSSDYEITHGSAVAIGMVIMTIASVKMGLCKENILDKLLGLLNKFGLPTTCEYSAKELVEGALGDKKRTGDTISVIMAYGLGDARICKVKVYELEKIFEKGLEK